MVIRDFKTIRYRFIICTLLTLLITKVGYAQNILDSTMQLEPKEFKKLEFKKSLYLTVPLITAGAIAKTNNNFFSNSIFENARNRRFPTFQSNLDDYLALAPAGAVFLIDIFDRKARSSPGNQTLLLIKSAALATAIVFPVKELTKSVRPDRSSDQSFPSAHTAQAFIAATFLHKEFGHRSIAYSIIGYTAASTVGVYRVLNNKHFVSDVLVGAGIGVLTTNIAYLTHKNRWGKKRNYHLSLVPTYQNNNLGALLQVRF